MEEVHTQPHTTPICNKLNYSVQINLAHTTCGDQIHSGGQRQRSQSSSIQKRIDQLQSFEISSSGTFLCF